MLKYRIGGKEMKGKSLKGYLEWFVLGIFLILMLGMGVRMTVGQEIGVYLNASNSSYTLNQDLSVSNDTGANTFGIFVDNDISDIFSDLTINATLSVNQTNSISETITIGIFANGTLEEGAQIRPIGNLTITENGVIQVLANGTEVGAGGVVVGNVTDNLINEGLINIFGNVTDSSGQLMLAGVYALNATNFVNSGDINVNGTGGYVDYAENNIPVGVEIESVDNFTNTGDISVSIESINATAVGVKSEDIGYFNNTGNISVFTNSTGGEWSAVVGVMAGLPEEIEGGESGEIGIFINDGNLTVSGYADGGELNAAGVAVFNGMIDEFRNLEGGKIEVYGENSGGDAYAYGVFADNYIGNFTNEGSISASAIGGDAGAFGVYADIGNFTNTGSIDVSATATGGTARAFGVGAEGGIGNFTNEGSISASARSISATATGETKVYAYGVYVDSIEGNFVNSGTISAVAEAGNATGSSSEVYADAWGLWIEGNVGNFTNSGNIVVVAKAGNAEGDNSYVYAGASGVYIEGSVENFINSGTIKAVAQIGNNNATGNNAIEIDSYDYYISGVYIGGPVNNFTNSGNIYMNAIAGTGYGGNNYYSDVYIENVYGVFLNSGAGTFNNTGLISVQAQVGDSEGYYTWVGIEYIYGVYSKGEIESFINSGTISVVAEAGDAKGFDDSEAYIEDVYGVYIEDRVGNFTNTGAINVAANVGDASGEDSEAYIEDIVGVYVNGAEDANITNKGIIQTLIKGGSGSEIQYIAGLVVEGTTNATISNEGLIFMNINAPDAKSVSNIAGIVVSGSSDVTISNPGAIWLSIFGPEAENVRTLCIEDSTVTLDGSFSIVFGSPGINPSTNSTDNLSQRPIYVDSSSTLNLNGADLIARVDLRNLKFNTKYYLIDNQGTVNEEWGNLVRGYANPEVTVSWAGEDKGENSAVMFGYVPGAGSLTAFMGPTASQIVSSSIVHMILGESPIFSDWIFGERDYRRFILASAGVPVVRKTSNSKFGIFFMPLYTKVNADDLNFDANAYGFSLGLEGKFLKDLTATLYGGYSRVNLDFKGRGPKDENQELYVAGFSLNYMPKPYFVRFRANYHWADHEYEGLTGANYELKEKADYDSWGVDMELTGGYILRKGNFFIAPEIGFGYTYYKADDFHTKVSSAPQWNRYYEAEKVDFLKGIFGLHLGGSDKTEKVRLYGSLRLEQAFGDNDVSVISYLQGLPKYKLEKDISNTTFVGQAGVNLNLGKGLSLDISGRGDFNGDYSAYSGKAMLRYSF